LDQVLCSVPRVTNENVLVGFDKADDAGVYKLTPELALVQTVDFFTPIVDDPHTFGAVAAANALSDVYAMGGRPISALAIVAYPQTDGVETLTEIMTGGAEKVREADCVIVGGHSINDAEIKFGYAITGTVHPDRVLSNAGARPGDALILTKCIGTGVVSTALKRGLASEAHVDASVASMLELNRAACEAMLAFDVHGCTDVTGFGLVGHAREMARGSEVTLEIESSAVQFLPGAVDYARQGAIPGGLKNNRSFAAADIELADGIPEEIVNLLHDPQTSGGLLIALPETDAAKLEQSFTGAYRVGRVTERGEKAIRLT
jgi:selenide, water dikinase